MYQNRWTNNQNAHQPPSHQEYVHGAPGGPNMTHDMTMSHGVVTGQRPTYYPNASLSSAPAAVPPPGRAGPNYDYYRSGPDARQPEYESQYRQPMHYQPEYQAQPNYATYPQPQHQPQHQHPAGYATVMTPTYQYGQSTPSYPVGPVAHGKPSAVRAQYGSPQVPQAPQAPYSSQVSTSPNSSYAAVSYQPSENNSHYQRTTTEPAYYGGRGKVGMNYGRRETGTVRGSGRMRGGYESWPSRRYEPYTYLSSQSYSHSHSHSRARPPLRRGGRGPRYAVQVSVDPRRPHVYPIQKDPEKTSEAQKGIDQSKIENVKAISQSHQQQVEMQVQNEQAVNEILEEEEEVVEEEEGEEEEEELSVYIPAYQVGASSSLDYLEVSRRHDRLVIPNDFVRVINHWISYEKKDKSTLGSKKPLKDLWHSSLGRSLSVHHEVCSVASQLGATALGVPIPQSKSHSHPQSSNEAKFPLYNAKVLLLSGLSSDEKKSLTNLDKQSEEELNHITRLIKFVVARSEKALQGEIGAQKSGLFLLGGRYIEAVDGPLNNEDEGGVDTPATGLKRAAIRHVAALTGIDLSKAQSWHRCIDICYVRPPLHSDPASVVGRDLEFDSSLLEITSVFVVDDAQACFPQPEDWPAAWERRHMQRLETLPGGRNLEEGEVCEPAAMTDAPPTTGPCLMSIGLVTADHVKVKTMTLSLDGLLDYNDTDVEEGTFEVSLVAEALHEMLMRDAGSAVLKALVERPWEKEKLVEGPEQQDTEQQETKRLKMDHHREESWRDEVFAAFSYFDLAGLGYLFVDDVVAIIESLGKGVHHGALHQLCSQLALESRKEEEGDGPLRINYRDLLSIK
jgi:hypothetical protein